ETDISGATNNDSRICNGYGGTTLTGSGAGTGGSYAWNPNIGSGAGAYTVAPTSNTTYNLTVTDTHGCTDAKSLIVQVDPLPTAPSSWTESYATACTAGNVTYSVSGSGPYHFNWTLTSTGSCAQCTGCNVATNSSVSLYFGGCSNGNTATLQ